MVWSMAGMNVYAGDINQNESEVIREASGTFEYKGKSYTATEEALEKLRTKLSQDDVDLTQEQAKEVITLAYANVSVGIEKGYLVPTSSGEAETMSEQTEAADFSEPSKEVNVDLPDESEKEENSKIVELAPTILFGILGLTVLGAAVMLLQKRGDQSGRGLCREKKLIDIHCHILPGVDDGAKDMDETMEMLDIAEKAGVSTIIATPHYIKGKNKEVEELRRIFEEVQKNAMQRFPQIQIYLGNEIYYTNDILQDLSEGKALTMAESRYVLIEFLPSVMYSQILNAVRSLKMAGYLPILAHIERYACLTEKDGERHIEELRKSGAYFQINGKNLQNRAGKKWSERILKKYGIDFIASDGHNKGHRTPEMKFAVGWITRKFGKDMAKKIFVINPQKILNAEKIKN